MIPPPSTSTCDLVLSPARCQTARAFSLIEVVIAIGILSFAFVAIFGMIPVGLATARDSIDRTQISQITQRMIADVQQTPFTNLSALYGQKLYFDGDGQEIPSSAGYVYTAALMPITDAVKVTNTAAMGLSASKTRLVLILIAKNSDVLNLGTNKPFSQTPFAVADIKL